MCRFCVICNDVIFHRTVHIGHHTQFDDRLSRVRVFRFTGQLNDGEVLIGTLGKIRYFIPVRLEKHHLVG